MKIIKLTKFFTTILFLIILFLEILRPWTYFPIVNDYRPSLSESQKQILSIVDLSFLGNWSNFAYFTILSNMLMLFSLAYSWIFFQKTASWYKNAIFCYMIITSIVFWTSIAPFLPWLASGSWFIFINIFLHAFTTILSFFWYLETRNEQISFKKTWWKMLIYPIIYLVYSTIIFLASKLHYAVYPFIHFTNWFSFNLNIYLSIFLAILTIILITFLFILIYWFLIKFKKTRLLRR